MRLKLLRRQIALGGNQLTFILLKTTVNAQFPLGFCSII